MDTDQNYRITVCTMCKHKGTDCRSGFEVSGIACMAGCDRPCTVAYHASRKATYLFGDIDPAVDIDDLVTFALEASDARAS